VPELFDAKVLSGVTLAAPHPPELQPLLDHIAANIDRHVSALAAEHKTLEVYGPDWCRDESVTAGAWHAEVIVDAYGSTYALPNKDPIANQSALRDGALDMYLMRVAGELTGTTCLVKLGDGRAELGRSASRGKARNGIIQDLRIFDWLVNPDAAARYHTLVTTLRSAPDRTIDEADGSTFVMRGGQAVTEHWRKFPTLQVNGFAPLYFKHGALEQFSCASLTRNKARSSAPIYVEKSAALTMVAAWHDEYGLAHPDVQTAEGVEPTLRFEAHFPPAESGLTNLVHADIVVSRADHALSLDECLKATVEAGSPFVQVVLPIDQDTRSYQASLEAQGFQVFAYENHTDVSGAHLLYGQVAAGNPVVPTEWDETGVANPFWKSAGLADFARQSALRW
jgi:hypothetical protein